MTKYSVGVLKDDWEYVSRKRFKDWTKAQDFAVQLLEDGEEWVQIRTDGGLLQELNLERGIMPDPNFSTHSLAPYYVRLRNYDGIQRSTQGKK